MIKDEELIERAYSELITLYKSIEKSAPSFVLSHMIMIGGMMERGLGKGEESNGEETDF